MEVTNRLLVEHVAKAIKSVELKCNIPDVALSHDFCLRLSEAAINALCSYKQSEFKGPDLNCSPEDIAEFKKKKQKWLEGLSTQNRVETCPWHNTERCLCSTKT